MSPRSETNQTPCALTTSDGFTGVRTRIAEPWILSAVSLVNGEPIGPRQAWRLLRRNAGLTGAVRLALTPGQSCAHLRADAFIDDARALDVQFQLLSQELRSALLALSHAGHTRGERLIATPDMHPNATADDGYLVSLCSEAGWPCAARSHGGVTLSIEAGSALYQAEAELTDDGAFRASVELVDASSLSTASRAATALLLLEASAVFRSLKGVVTVRDGVEFAALTTASAAVRSGADLDRALTALAVACRFVGKEVPALRHAALAREYLVRRMPAPIDEESGSVFDDTHGDHAMREAEETPCLQQL